jgi:light-regulated signal transduction histidine kinase (bacteriophytochrome)
MLRMLDEGVERARQLVDSILAYAKAADDSASRTEVDCGAVVTEVLAAFASQIGDTEGRVDVAPLPTHMYAVRVCSGSFRT